MNMEFWIDKFNKMNKKDQLKLAKEINEILEENELTLREEEYDRITSSRIRKIFDKVIGYGLQTDSLIKARETIDRFNNLTRKNQLKVINTMTSSIEENYNNEINERNKAICEKEGHDFGEWYERRWETQEDLVMDHNFFSLPLTMHEYRRECSRCGYTETSKYEPGEIKNKRIRKAKLLKIKKLQDEIDKLR